MNFKRIIEKIHTIQKTNLVDLTDFRGRGVGKGTELLPVKSRGLYWLWSKTPIEKLAKSLPSEGAHVPIDKLLKNRSGLSHICKVSDGDYRVLYNGIGGYTTWTKKSVYGLRGRINQEVNCNNIKTGTLNIAGRGLSIDEWKVSFFNFDDSENRHILEKLAEEEKVLDVAKLYNDYANELEILWRMHYGTPILCRH